MKEDEPELPTVAGNRNAKHPNEPANVSVPEIGEEVKVVEEEASIE